MGSLNAKRLLLFGWLGYMLLANAWAAYRTWMVIDDFVRHSDPRYEAPLTWALPALIALALVNVLAVLLLFSRRKLGLWVFIATSIAALIINLILQVPLTASLIGLIGPVVLYALVNMNEDYFTRAAAPSPA